MKITLSNTLLIGLSNNIIALGNTLSESMKSHKSFSSLRLKQLRKKAEQNDLDLEELLIKEEKKTSFELFKSLPIPSNITNFVSELVSINKTEEEVIISINDKFILELHTASTEYLCNCIKPTLDLICINDEYDEKTTALLNKWKDNTQVNKDNKFNIEEGTIVKSRMFNDEMILIPYLYINEINSSDVLNITPAESFKFLSDNYESEEYSKDLIKEVKEYILNRNKK